MHLFSEHSSAHVSIMAFHESPHGEHMYRPFCLVVTAGYGCNVSRIAPRHKNFETPCVNPDLGHAALRYAAMVGLPRLFNSP
jgi:hypothetical protein